MSITPSQEQSAPSRMATGVRIPSLDGLRAISIMLVLLGHLAGTRGFGEVDLGIGDFAHMGVQVFFVISGFLITRLLLAEQQRKGSVSLRRFYARRCLRLFPACYAYIAVVSVLALVGFVSLTARDQLHSITYTVNFLPHAAWEIGHLWSLSVEEQFYLLWPFAFVMLAPRRAGWAAAGVVVLGPLARIANRFLLTGSPYQNLNMFPMVADSLAVGCLLTLGRGWLESQGWYARLLRPLPSLITVVVMLAINRFGGYTIGAVFGMAIINFCIALLIHRSVVHPGDWAGRILNWSPLVFVGTLSYSLYVWQQLFLNRDGARWMNAFPQNLALAIATGLASYFLLEMPLLRLRERLRA